MARVVYPPSGVTTARRLSDALTRYKYWHASRGGMASSPDHGKTCGRRGRFRPISLGNIADRNFPISDGDKAHIREGIQPPAPPRPEPIPGLPRSRAHCRADGGNRCVNAPSRRANTQTKPHRRNRLWHPRCQEMAQQKRAATAAGEGTSRGFCARATRKRAGPQRTAEYAKISERALVAAASASACARSAGNGGCPVRPRAREGYATLRYPTQYQPDPGRDDRQRAV